MTRLTLGIVLLLAAMTGLNGAAVAQDQPANNGAVVVTTNAPPVRIGSRWIASTFLNTEGGKLQNTVIQLGWVSSMWTIDTIQDNQVRIRSVWQNDQYLNLDSTGALASSPVAADAPSAQWTMEPVGRGFYVRFRSVANPDLYINVAEGKLQVSAIQPDSLSADWWILK